MTELQESDQIKAYYEEQLESQRGMLTSAIDTLVQKKNELELAVKEIEKRNFELNQISDRTFHDMREPMVALLGLVQMLRDETESESAEYLLNLAEASVKRLDNFSLSLAAYVRGIQKEFVIEEIDGKTFFDELLLSLEDLEGRDRVELNICNKSIENSPTIKYDREKLSLILKNLISNAVKFRDIDKEISKVEVAYRVKNNRTLIMVRDNGMGISPSVMKNVTKMFFRGSQKSTGVGLGLYMVRTLLEDSGGHLRIQSKEGEGTTIYLVLSRK